MSDRNFFSELRRRNVYKVAVAYIVAGWALSQGIAQVFPVFDIPNWIIRALVVLTIAGLPVALVLAWMFEITPQGIKRTATADALPASARPKKYGWVYVVIIGVAVSIGLFFLGRYTASTPRQSEAATGTPAKSIAVLPFDNLSRDPDNAYFTEGVQDEILTRLAKVADLKVISRTSTQRFKSAPENLPQIAKQLGVTNILEGSVQKVADRVRVNVQLINALTDEHLWADTYDRKLTDIFAVESEIAQAVAASAASKTHRFGRKVRLRKSRPKIRKRTNFISRADFSGTNGPEWICGKPSNTSSRLSRRIRTTPWRMPESLIRICYFRTMEALPPRNHLLRPELR